MNSRNVNRVIQENEIISGSSLAQLPVFVAVAELCSFTRAARRLRLSTSATSQAVQRLEQQLGVALLRRTTRSVNLTEAGARLLRDAKPALVAASSALGNARSRQAELSGTLRLNVPRIACRVGLPRLLGEFTRRHPRVHVEVDVDDRAVDIVKGGFDAGIRSRAAIHKDMVQVRLTPEIRFAVVGARRYFAAHGKPERPSDLVQHVCLGWRSLNGGAEYRWEFRDRGKEVEVAVNGSLASNDTELLLACAVQGMGLAFVVETEARRELDAGAVERVLDDYVTTVDGLFLYFPAAARSEPKLRAFLNCAREQLAAQRGEKKTSRRSTLHG